MEKILPYLHNFLLYLIYNHVLCNLSFIRIPFFVHYFTGLPDLGVLNFLLLIYSKNLLISYCFEATTLPILSQNETICFIRNCFNYF